MRAVLFDLDNTLIDRDAAFEACLAEDFPRPEARARVRRIDAGGHGCRSALFRAWGGGMDQPTLARRLVSHLRPQPDLLASLQALAKSSEIGIISNGGGATQRLKIKAAGLDQVFSPGRVWISGEVGWEKPDPRIFWHACREIGVAPADCLYVGDSDEIDGAGARAAGLGFQSGWTP